MKLLAGLDKQKVALEYYDNWMRAGKPRDKNNKIKSNKKEVTSKHCKSADAKGGPQKEHVGVQGGVVQVC